MDGLLEVIECSTEYVVALKFHQRAYATCNHHVQTGETLGLVIVTEVLRIRFGFW
jgi:hypothetical protein